jgi:hypothetical protein
MTVDLADEAQGEVKLVLVLPAGPRHSLHQVEQPLANGARGPQGDEQAIHGGSSLSGTASGRAPVFLE